MSSLNPQGLKTYLGNPNVKADGVQQPMTQAQLVEYTKCANDPVYFARNHVKIISLNDGLVNFDLWPYQEEMYDVVDSNRFSIVMAPRQSGKSMAFVIYLLWYALFKPEQTIVILANKGDTAQEMLTRVILALENLPFYMQPGTKVLNRRSIEFSNNSRIYARPTSASSIRGMSVQLVFMDEFALVDHDEEFYTSTYPVISSGTDTKIIITSTPKGVGNMFHKIWQGAKSGSNGYTPFEVHWSDVPGRDANWKTETIRNTSEQQFRQEFSCEFIGSGDTLISSNTLLGLMAESPTMVTQNVRIYDKPQRGHNYIMCVDTAKGKGQDSSAFSIIDVSQRPYKIVASYHDNKISPLLLPTLLVEMARKYNEAYMVIESNDQGFLVAKSVQMEHEYDSVYYEPKSMRGSGKTIGLTMSAKVKKIGCTVMRDLIEYDRLQITDRHTIVELTTFEAKNGLYEAAKGAHDDLVMTLVLFSYFTTQPQFSNFDEAMLKDIIFDADAIKELEANEVPPFGLIDNHDGSQESDPALRQEVIKPSVHYKVRKDEDFGWVDIELEKDLDGFIL